MMNKSKVKQFLSIALAAAGFVLASGASADVLAQRDPFEKSPLTKPRVVNPNPGTGAAKSEKPKPAGPPPVVSLGAPPIDQRINYYKQMREEAAASGREIPKVTSVLTLDEMSVVGIFRTPRGYAAMVQAAPINLSYTIYPGEKFFDGQLVAVEENRLVFRKVAKLSNGKFTASVQNKTLRQYSVKEEVQGTAPVQSGEKPAESATAVVPHTTQPNGTVNTIVPTVGGMISPLEEMLKQPVEKPNDSAKKDGKDKKDTKAKNAKEVKKGKKPVKVAENKQQ